MLRVRSYHFTKEGRYKLAAIGVEVCLLAKMHTRKNMRGGGGERDSVGMGNKKNSSVRTQSHENTAELRELRLYPESMWYLVKGQACPHILEVCGALTQRVVADNFSAED